jgi:nitrate/TMAO reductase-like tetraheme cytochrome c subunit
MDGIIIFILLVAMMIIYFKGINKTSKIVLLFMFVAGIVNGQEYSNIIKFNNPEKFENLNRNRNTAIYFDLNNSRNNQNRQFIIFPNRLTPQDNTRTVFVNTNNNIINVVTYSPRLPSLPSVGDYNRTTIIKLK